MTDIILSQLEHNPISYNEPYEDDTERKNAASDPVFRADLQYVGNNDNLNTPSVKLIPVSYSFVERKEKDLDKSYYELFHELIHSLMNKKERRLYYFAIFCTVCSGILRLIFFIFLSAIIDLLANTYNINLKRLCSTSNAINCESQTMTIHTLTIILINLCFMASIINYAQSMMGSKVCCSFLKRLNCLTFNKIMAQNLSFFDCRDEKDLKYLLSNDMKHIRFIINKLLIMIESLMHFICGLLYLFIINWDIALIIITSFIFLSISSIIYINRNTLNSKHRLSAFRVILQGIQQMLNYIATIKIFTKEEDEAFIYKQCIDRAFDFHHKSDKYLYCFQFWMKIIWYFTTLSIIWYGSLNTNVYSLGILMIDLVIFLQLNFSIYQIIILSPSVIIKGATSIQRILNIFSIKNDGDKNNDYIPPKDEIEGIVEFKNVEFSYPNELNKLVLDVITLKFKPSTTTALVGVSGCGKTSIFKLLMGFYSPLKGEILIDNVNINKYNLGFLHSRIGYVGQKIHLFENRTIADNIKYGMKLDQKHHYMFDAQYFDEESMYFWRKFKSITKNDVENAAKIANAHGFIMNLKKGYDTIIGGIKGIKLSSGERQRIAIARAVLLNPKILLMDEAMSNVDPISKHLIKESLDTIMIGRCVVVIAHRLKTVINADLIYIINNGRIVEYGKHDELIQIKDGYYSQFIQKQKFA